MDRRSFFKSSLAGAGLAAGLHALPASALAAQPKAAKPKAILKLCSQDGKIPGKSFAEKIKLLEKCGGLGVELGGNPKNRIKEVKEALADSPVKVSALCWGSCKGDLVSTDAAKRKDGSDQLKSALETAGELGANGVIFVPCFHKQSSLKPDELDRILSDVLPPLAEFAEQHKTKVLLEPLRKGETFYINRLEQAVKICREVKHPGLAIMGDFFHMNQEETDERAAFILADDLLRHVHIASRKTRTMPGTDDDSYVKGMGGLKAIGYQQYISLECGYKKDQNKDEAFPKCFELLKEQWEQATA